VVSIGHALLEIGDLSQIEVVADLLSTEAVQVKQGHRVLIEQWGGDETLEGSVRLVEPSGFTKISALGVEEQRVNVIVDFRDPEKAARRMGDAYRVEVRIVVWEDEDVLRVPVSALFRHEDQWAVYRIDNGRAVRRLVQIGRRNSLDAQVLDGLGEGDQVVVYPGENVRDAARVVVREA
jgi:HlyD family secretion protein